MSDERQASAPAAVRLDLWLWAARLYRTRALAKAAIAAGRVAVNGQPAKASRSVRIGDRLCVVRGGERIECVVTGSSAQRGPAAIAQTLWQETEASRAARMAARERRQYEARGFTPPAKRPDKRARRLLAMLGDFDAN